VEITPTIIEAPAEPQVQPTPPPTEEESLPVPVQEGPQSFDDCQVVRNGDVWRILADGWSQRVNNETKWYSFEEVMDAVALWRKTR